MLVQDVFIGDDGVSMILARSANTVGTGTRNFRSDAKEYYEGVTVLPVEWTYMNSYTYT